MYYLRTTKVFSLVWQTICDVLHCKTTIKECLETIKVTPTSFWLKRIDLSKFCSTDKLEVASKYFSLLTKKYLMDWQILRLKDGMSGNLWFVYQKI